MSSAEDVAGRRCASCGNLASADDEYCTRCGSRVSDTSNVIPFGATTPGGLEPAVFTSSPPRRRSRGVIVALALVSIACVVLAAATLLSRQELADTRSELEASEEQVTTLEATRSRLTTELAATRGISEKRAGVLLRANNVLGGLDPLLASVDALKKDTREIQRGRTDFQAAADELIQTTITLINYLVNTESGSVEVAYVNDLIDQANNELDTVDYYGSQLSLSDESYSRDAASFDTRATGFSASVAALKNQLKQVTR